jgi:hypothetical protein
MAGQIEFLTPAWLAELRRLLAEFAPATKTVLGDGSFTFEERFAGVPPDGRTVGWYCTFHDGEVAEFDSAPAGHADLCLQVPYELGVKLATTVVGSEPEAQAAYRAMTGRVERRVNCEPQLAMALTGVLAGLHDVVAAMTAPPRT